MYTGFRCGNLRDMHHLADGRVDRRIKIKGIFKKWDGCMDWIFMAQDRDMLAGFCGCGNELSDSIKCGKFLD